MVTNFISEINNITEDLSTLNPYFNDTDFINHTNYTYIRNFTNFTTSNFNLIKNVVVIVCYSIIVVVSIFGNLLVCNIVASRKSMRRTTNIFIANLALSDIIMTVLNIPFAVTRVMLFEWPFGGFMCSFVPLVQAISVYVSTFTMMFIALDRYRVICNPLMPRMSPLQALKSIIFVWLAAVLLSLPHAVFNQLEYYYSTRWLVRCMSQFPGQLRVWIPVVTVLTQYVLPLSITGMAYFLIVAKVWSRDVLGHVTEAQLVTRAKAKRKTIKMLVLVVILFALCWLPLNVYNLLKLKFTYKSDILYYACHWFAMSSVCYNPFIYCWLNQNFRSGAIACLLCIRNVGRKLNSSFRSTRDFRLTDVRCDFPSQSCDDSKTDSAPIPITEGATCYLDQRCETEAVPMKCLYVARCSESAGRVVVETTRNGDHHSAGSRFNAPTLEGTL